MGEFIFGILVSFWSLGISLIVGYIIGAVFHKSFKVNKKYRSFVPGMRDWMEDVEEVDFKWYEDIIISVVCIALVITDMMLTISLFQPQPIGLGSSITEVLTVIRVVAAIFLAPTMLTLGMFEGAYHVEARKISREIKEERLEKQRIETEVMANSKKKSAGQKRRKRRRRGAVKHGNPAKRKHKKKR